MCRYWMSEELIDFPKSARGHPFYRYATLLRLLCTQDGSQSSHHLLIQPGSLARPQSAAMAAIGLFVRHLDKTKEWMLRLQYLGAGRLATVDKYYNLSYQKTIIIIIFPTHPTAWSPLSVHQAISPSIIPFYNTIKDTPGTIKNASHVRTYLKKKHWMHANSTGNQPILPGSNLQTMYRNTSQRHQSGSVHGDSCQWSRG